MPLEAGYYDVRTYTAAITRLLSLVPDKGIVIDVGCGSGRFTQFLLESRSDIQVVALDVNESELKILRDRLQPELLVRCLLVKASLKEIQEAAGVFDACMCLEVIYLQRDALEEYQRISHILRGGGVALVSNPSISSYFVHTLLNGDLDQLEVLLRVGLYVDAVHGSDSQSFPAQMIDRRMMEDMSIASGFTLLESWTKHGVESLALHGARLHSNVDAPTRVGRLLEEGVLSGIEIPRLYIDLLWKQRNG
jgi:SAM-dependent methyltransferase